MVHGVVHWGWEGQTRGVLQGIQNQQGVQNHMRILFKKCQMRVCRMIVKGHTWGPGSGPNSPRSSSRRPRVSVHSYHEPYVPHNIVRRQEQNERDKESIVEPIQPCMCFEKCYPICSNKRTNILLVVGHTSFLELVEKTVNIEESLVSEGLAKEKKIVSQGQGSGSNDSRADQGQKQNNSISQGQSSGRGRRRENRGDSAGATSDSDYVCYSCDETGH
ncbi:unnamed protein product [Arabis nemorensis]|uniref:Uncharacterized protein n=1 Tax=Arabis nemorensis TaxID=586526 RepID=A0A565AYF8_9BRAS|nr:unnamed protein product [Arabis nemorensis]